MIIEINTDSIINKGLTANQLLIAQLIYERNYTILEQFKTLWPILFEADLDSLIGAGYLRKSGNGDYRTYLFLTPLLEMCGDNTGGFENLFAAFPVFVIRPDGTKDYLRADKSHSRKLYDKLVGKKKAKQDFVKQCLELELKVRNAENKLSYMKRLSNWLSTQEWEAWAERLKEDSNLIHKEDNYGQSLE